MLCEFSANLFKGMSNIEFCSYLSLQNSDTSDNYENSESKFWQMCCSTNTRKLYTLTFSSNFSQEVIEVLEYQF